ncbi:MAG: hypothetical protein LQ340_004150, partial [Diploschistes diacapsis]
KLEKGIAAYKAIHPSSIDTFSVEWLPFYLNPGAPKEGIDKQQMYNAKFGPERTRMMQERLASVGKDVGIKFKFGGRTGNTRDSHRLIQLAKTSGPDVQKKTVESLFEAYFEHEQDITSHKVLKAAGLKAGLTEAELDDWLQSDKGGKEVDEEVAQSMANIVTGVPNFTIQYKFEVQGAQDSEGFKRIFEKVKELEA